MSRSRQNPEAVRRLLQQGKGHVHMVGVCGVGMAGVARLLKARGLAVSGCDAHRNRLADWLKPYGIRVAEGHAPAHLRGAPDWIVRTPAVAEDNPEIVHARRAGLPMFFRGEVLPELLADHTSVAVCGTHGKTTTTTFVTQLLRSAGRDPSWCIGGENPALDGVAGVGKGDAIVVEADESDGTLALYHPDIAVVTNIEFDHMEHFESVAAFENCFRTFIGNTRRRVVYGAGDPRARALCRGNPNSVSFGLCDGADVRGSALKLTDTSLSFMLQVAGKRQGRIELPVPGRHNALNALAAIAVGLELGLRTEEIRRALRQVSLPRRRFETIVEKRGVRVISDYAHHPSEIRALVRAALKLKHKRLVAVYQPHRYTRTLALGPDFPPAFEGVDELVLCPVYAASEKPLPGGMIWDLYGHFRKRSEVRGQRSEDRGQVSVATSLEQAWGYFRHELKKGDVFLVTGAGDVERIAGWAKEEMMSECSPQHLSASIRPALISTLTRRRRPAALHWNPLACLDEGFWRAVGLHRRVPVGASVSTLGHGGLVRFDEPLANKTTLKVGGCADIWAEVETLNDLVRLLTWTHKNDVPFHLLGAGSNVLVSDLGVRGIVARLTGKDFKRIQEERGGIRVGVGVPLARLVEWMEKRGAGGYEFLDGIPGTVGGALRMNAGAWGREIVARVNSVRCLDRDGSACAIAGKKLKFRYRGCDGLGDRIVVDVLLAKGEPVGPEVVRARCVGIAAKRRWWKGLRCAGSIFKNPPGQFAGRLIEQAGFKGRRVGGASVSRRHANVIVTEQGALASDVRCLIETIRGDVQRQTGVQLETEVVFLE